MAKTTATDRRQAPRYALNTDVFLVFRPDFSKLGKLKDVSNGGVAVEYTVLGEHEKIADADVDIFTSGSDYLMLRRVPCTVVYDTKIEKGPLSGIETRRCGLRFEQLSDQQGEQLKVLLNNYVSHRLPVQYPAGGPAASSLQ